MVVKWFLCVIVYLNDGCLKTFPVDKRENKSPKRINWDITFGNLSFVVSLKHELFTNSLLKTRIMDKSRPVHSSQFTPQTKRKAKWNFLGMLRLLYLSVLFHHLFHCFQSLKFVVCNAMKLFICHAIIINMDKCYTTFTEILNKTFLVASYHFHFKTYSNIRSMRQHFLTVPIIRFRFCIVYKILFYFIFYFMISQIVCSICKGKNMN